MSQHKPSFKEDGYRRIFCPSCKGFIHEHHLDQEKPERKKCDCGAETVFPVPEKRLFAGERIIAYGPRAAIYTADLTEFEKGLDSQ